MIDTGGSGRLWLLSGPGSAYALQVTDRDELLHLHWGAPIALPDAEALAAEPPPAERPFESALDGREEYPVEGGPRFVRPALSVRSEHGGEGPGGDGPVRGTEWCFEEDEIAAGPDGEELRLHFHDSLHHLDLTLHYRLRPACDVVERWITAGHVGHAGTPALELLRADAATWTLPHRPAWRMSQLHGRWGAETQLARAPLAPGEHVIGSRRGHTSHQHLPWFALDEGEAGEEHGQVWSGALAWSGSWRIAIAALPGGRVQVTGGAGHDDAGLVRLTPGGGYTSPVFAGLYSAGGFGAASRAWHAYQRDHVLPGGPPHTAPLRPVAYRPGPPAGPSAPAAATAHGAGAAAAPGPDLAQHRELARRAAQMGVELYVVDACRGSLFGAQEGSARGGGRPGGSLPGGGPLKEFADEVHGLGMRLGVRVEPETVEPGGDLHRAHPDWVQRQPGRRGAEQAGRLVLNLARPDVLAHVAGELDALLHGAPVDHLAWDVSRSFTEAGWPGDRYPQRLWTGHVHGLYALFDRLRAAHPDLTVESGAGGGGRTDLGVLARVGQVETSATTDPLDRLAVQHGFSQLHPASAMSAPVTAGRAPGPNHRGASMRFRFVTAMAGVLGLDGDLLEWGAHKRAEAASWIALYKSVRPVVHDGDLYRLRPPGDGGVSAVQYVLGDDTVVLAWLQAQRFGEPAAPLRLRGLQPGAAYRDVATGVVRRGAVLAEHGLRTTLGGDLDAAVFHLRRG
ncbi:alpha-galactosidase [Actinacidiphila rubida]|uniref:Alpha-galactosidase n=1 Tax=Actinacidiphila rubida TaxID=310780 RepID=A0A1H8T2B6_9ACTN|nr:alpha-galactosidase [Actinacidiphila rubida]SEO85111.1 alpha-galactosidase [Actinacidiphila rubida]